MPFGLCNALATFQRCMLSIFSDMVERIMEVFMDDITVYGSSYEECLLHLEAVLHRCIEKDLVLNWEKCHFMVQKGIVLGHIISKNGIEVDKAKVELIVKFPRVHAILHSFTYLLKPLTQAPYPYSPYLSFMLLITTFIPPGHIASKIPPPLLHPDTSHRNSSRHHSTRTSPHSKILLCQHSIRASRIRKFSSANILYGISHSEFSRRHSIRTNRIRNSSAAIPSGHIASGIPPLPFHLDVPRIWNSSPPTFHLSRISHIRNPIL